MRHDLKDVTILTLAEILVGNQVDTRVVTKALEQLCSNLCFDYAMVYEWGNSDEFCLMEYYAPALDIPSKRFPINDFTDEEQVSLTQVSVSYMDRESITADIEAKLLDICNAASLVLAPVSDENDKVSGFVMMLNKAYKEPFAEEDKKVLTVSISMIVRYVAMRICQKKLRQMSDTLENVLDNTGIDIYVNEFDSHDILYVNKSMAAPYGGREWFMSRKCWQVLFPGQSGPCDFCPKEKLIDEDGQPTKVHSWDYQRAFDGSWFRVFSAAFRWTDGRLAHIVSSADITENKRNEELINKLANYDHLTGLPNRRMLLLECERRIDKATDAERGYLLFFDIDGFKSINDNLGHVAGDEFLIQLGEFFSGIPLLKDAIYRNGGDEFVAIIGGEEVTKDNIRSLAFFIHTRFKRTWKLTKGEVLSSTSIGVACYPEDGRTAEKLLQRADMAMYKVKKSGGAGLCFGYHLDEELH